MKEEVPDIESISRRAMSVLMRRWRMPPWVDRDDVRQECSVGAWIGFTKYRNEGEKRMPLASFMMFYAQAHAKRRLRCVGKALVELQSIADSADVDDPFEDPAGVQCFLSFAAVQCGGNEVMLDVIKHLIGDGVADGVTYLKQKYDLGPNEARSILGGCRDIVGAWEEQFAA